MANITKLSKIQDAMFQEIQDHQIFKSAQSYAVQYLNEVFDRNVYPTEEALHKLAHFEEEMPSSSGNVQAILDSLHHFGSPATLPTLGGRYFGFVTGSSIPATLAVKSLSDFWDQNSAMEVLSPISAKLETVVESWLRELLGLPPSTVAGFVSQFSQNLGDQGFEVLNEVVFNQVLIACGEDEMTEKVLKNLQELRVCWCGGSQWHGRKVIRISVCSWATTPEDVDLCVASFVKARELATTPELAEL